MHGQSEYTPTKQDHLRGLLTIGTHGWNPLTKIDRGIRWTHHEALFVDCTSGNGRDEQGNDGSPLIINEHFRRVGYPFRQLCCEQQASSFVRLQQTGIDVDFRLGKYEEVASGWLDLQNVTKPAMGFFYCDPNGVKDLLDGYDFFRKVSADDRYKRMDLIFHWSVTAYERSCGKKLKWANDELIGIIKQILSLKKYAIMRDKLKSHGWIFMYLHNSDKIDGRWRKEGFLPADEWMDRYLLANGQQPLFTDEVLQGLAA